MSKSPFDGMSRREFLTKVSAAGGAAMVASWASPVIEKAYAAPVSSGSLQSIEHIVLFMQENRSFDHYFGTLYGVEGFGNDPDNPPAVFKQRGWSPIVQGPTDWNDPDLYMLPFRLDTTMGPHLSGECVNDPDHSWIGMHKAWRNGNNDYWLPMSLDTRSSGNAPAVMGYYAREDTPIHHMLADKFTICDQYFASAMGPTVPNRLYWLSASIDPEGNFGGPQVETPLIWPKFKFSWRIMPEVLQQAGVSWKVYNNREFGPINRVLFDGMVGSFNQAADPRSYLWQRGIFPRYPLNFAADVAANNLPQVSWVVPPLIECEHPALPVALGAVGIVNLLRILLSNPKVWEKTAVIISYDENGGFFDHVTPPTPPPGTLGEFIPPSIVNNVSGSGGITGPIGLGNRVPCLVVSPYSRGGRVVSDVFDHTSQLRLIETRFLQGTGLQVPNLPTGCWRRDITGDMTTAFDFSAFDPSRPALGTPVLTALPKLPQCAPNVVTGTLNLGPSVSGPGGPADAGSGAEQTYLTPEHPGSCPWSAAKTDTTTSKPNCAGRASPRSTPHPPPELA